MCVNLYYKLIFINKFIRHNKINDLCCDINIFIYISILFLPTIFLFIIDYFFSIYLHKRLVVYLIGCVHKFFDLHL
jgi:hypothetical protein